MVPITLEILGENLLLAGALCLDALAASVGYGFAKIRIPWRSVFVIAGISAMTLLFSAAVGALLSTIIPSAYIKWVCFSLLLIPGVIKLGDSLIKTAIRRRDSHTQIKFDMLGLHFILQVYADPDTADIDGSKVLSARESVAIAIALSLDSLVVGIGAAMQTFSFAVLIPAAFLLCVAAVKLGAAVGGRASSHLKYDFTWVAGVLLGEGL